MVTLSHEKLAQKIALTYGAEYVDFNDFFTLDENKDFSDYDHLNREEIKKFGEAVLALPFFKNNLGKSNI